MAHPLLVDMAIHTFDSPAYLLGSEPVSVYCESFNPAWSWFAGDAAAQAVFEIADGARYGSIGSWCSAGAGDVVERRLAGERRRRHRRVGRRQ